MIFAVCALAMTTTSARETVEGSKLLDNISIGIAGGVYTPTTHAAFFKNMRPTANLTIAKQITPIYGLGFEGATAFNTKTIGWYSKTAFDAVNVNLMHYINLSNLFGGYQGQPRPVEFVAAYGLGWGHLFRPNYMIEDVKQVDRNFATSKAALNVNFNVSDAVQINVKPAIVWNLEGEGHPFVQYNANNSVLELTAGLTYKFLNSNGTHNFKIARLYDQGEIDGLNAKINDLRNQLNGLNGQLSGKDAQIKNLQDQLNECRNKAPQVVKEVSTAKELESVVTFAQGKSVIAPSQLPNVERIATYLKRNKDAKVVIKGYASPEGSAEINERLAKERAEAVKNQLIKKYKIAADRIEASGQGVGNMFSEPEWNRVSISTIKK